jgi:ATP-dependent DNA helicase RecG
MSESHNIEYRSSWRDEYLKWVCGFANAQGGTMYIGIDDGDSVVDLGDAHRLLEDIPNKIVSVLGIVAAVRLHESDRGRYIEISVEPQAFPVSCKGQYYMRVGATNQLLKGVALDTFLLRKQGQTWDAAAVPGLSLADLSTEAMLGFAKRARRKGRVPDDAESEGPRGLVHRLRLERDGYLTNAAALLFCPEPDVYVPGCSVKIGFFEGPEIIYQDEVGGPIVEQVDEVVELLYSKYLRAKISYDGIQRVERYPFPRAAVREVLVNAVAHKNYASGAPVQVRVYDDQLIVCNACVLPDGWGIEDLLGFHASEPHNPKIANAFFLAGLVESWGRGVQKVFTECKLDGILPPEYSLAGGSLLVRLTAPAERIVQTGSRMARKPGDSGENLAIGGAKPGDWRGKTWRFGRKPGD